MSGIDSQDVFALIVGAISTADAIARDPRLTAADRDAAGRIRDALRAWKSPAFRLRDWRPAAQKTATTT